MALAPTRPPAAARSAAYRAAGGPWDQPALDALLQARTASVQTALVVDGQLHVTGRELEAWVARAAGGLRATGVGAGDAVAWQLPNCVHTVVAYRACWRIGAVAVPIHHAFGPADRDRLVAATAPALVLDADGIDALEGDPVTEAWTDGDALAAVVFTSGSSGRPKGVLHTQHTLAYKARSMAAVHGLARDDAVLMPAPLAHISGLLNGITLPQATPFKSVLMARWDPDVALELIARERITFMIGPPTFFIGLMQSGAFSPRAVASLRLISSGGAGVSEAFVVDAAARFDCTVKRTYGSTEAPTIATSTPADDPTAAHGHDGRAIGAVELRTAPAAGGTRADAAAGDAGGDTGELLVRGPEVALGYLDEADNVAFDDDGWLHTGDLARTDADGWLTIVGRIKDVIIRGGENIAAPEVEAVLEAHPDVRQAAVVGYPDELMGERVCAFVVGDPAFDVAACREWFAAHGIAKYKTPERVMVLDALPVLATGKPDKEQLRRLARGNAL